MLLRTNLKGFGAVQQTVLVLATVHCQPQELFVETLNIGRFKNYIGSFSTCRTLVPVVYEHLCSQFRTPAVYPHETSDTCRWIRSISYVMLVENDSLNIEGSESTGTCERRQYKGA